MEKKKENFFELIANYLRAIRKRNWFNELMKSSLAEVEQKAMP